MKFVKVDGMGHEADPDELLDLGKWLKERIGNPERPTAKEGEKAKTDEMDHIVGAMGLEHRCLMLIGHSYASKHPLHLFPVCEWSHKETDLASYSSSTNQRSIG